MSEWTRPVHHTSVGQHLSSAPDGCEVIMWDGRLDNARDLSWRFGELCHGTMNPSEIVKLLYDKKGTSGLSHLIGDFNFVIRDSRNASLILATDFVGVRPLYFVANGNTVIYSGSLAGIINHRLTDAIDESFIASFLSCGGHPFRTPYAGVHVVPAGHVVRVKASKISMVRFWEPPAGDISRYKDERRYEEELAHIFREATAARLAMPGAVLAELSGGLDSSSVVSMASHLISTGAVAANSLETVSYVQPESSDTSYICEVERALGVRATHLSMVEAPLFCEDLCAHLMPNDQAPLHVAVANLALSKGATTLLTGQAGDLLMGNWLDDIGQISTLLRNGSLSIAVSEAFQWAKLTKTPVMHVLLRGLSALFSPPQSRSSVSGQVATSIAPALYSRTDGACWTAMFFDESVFLNSERREHLRLFAMLQGLRSLQRMEVLGGLDYTHPFADRRMVEFLMAVPADVLCRPGEPRRLMRRTFEKLWPPGLRLRRSKSLLGAHYFDAFRPFATRLMREQTWGVVQRGWIERTSFLSRLERFMHGLPCNEAQLRQVLIVEHWLQRSAFHRTSLGIAA